MAGWVCGWLAMWLIGYLAGWFCEWLMAGCVALWLWLAGLLCGCLCSWLAMWLAGFGAVPWVSGILASETIEVCSKYGSWDLHLFPGGSRSRLKHTTGRKGLLWEYHDPLIVGCLGQWYGPPSETAGSTALNQDSGNLPCQYITIAGLVFAPHMVLPKGPKGALVGAALGERRSTEKVLEVVKCPWGEPLETRPAKVLKSPHGLLENWQVPDPKVPTSLLDWFWRWHKVVRQVSCPINRSTDWLVICGARFPARWNMPAISSGVQGGFNLSPCWYTCRESGLRCMSIHWSALDMRGIYRSCLGLRWKSRQYCLQYPVLGPYIGSTPLGALVTLSITLPRVCLEMLLVDTLGLTSFFSFILTLSLTFGIFWCPQLLEEHPLIDLPGPK